MVIRLNFQKIRADDIILISIFCMFVFLLLFFRLIAIMSIFVFPFTSLFLYSGYKFGLGIFRPNFWLLLLGILGILISTFFLYLFFIQPNMTINYIIYFIGMPMMIIGFAGIIKGILIETYSIKWRIINVIIGNTTLIFTFFTFFFVEDLFLYNIFGFSLLLIINAFARVAMYLSEYHLSIKNLKNKVIIKLLIEILTELPIVEADDSALEFIDV